MANSRDKADFAVTFAGLEAGQKAPDFAVYRLDAARRPLAKIGHFDGKALKFDATEVSSVAFGPDVEDFKTLPPESLVSYRLEQNFELWKKRGVVLGPDVWQRFQFQFACVSGTVQKCRPWFWRLLDDVVLSPLPSVIQAARVKPITAELAPHITFPIHCVPLCDGIVEVYERECCCHLIHIPDLLDRLRDILDRLPVPIPDPIPDPIPGPDPAPFGGTRLAPRVLKTKARAIQKRAAIDLTAVPSEMLFQDYTALRALTADAAQAYVRERAYLYPIFCHCSLRKVGQTFLEPGGRFDLCYWRVPHPHPGPCVRTYAYKVKQLINGVWTVVYDGVAAHEYFAAGSPAHIHSYSPQARPCGDGPGDPPANGGDPFVMLEHIGSFGTFHFNFPAQTGVSQVGALGLNAGTFTTSDMTDCPWGGALGLRLWFSPELESTVHYYRLKVVAVNDAGMPTGTPTVLNGSVTWDKFVDVPGDVVRAPETLGPATVGGENDLFKVPYWSSPNHRYLSGQYHQVWNTALFTDGQYMLLIEVFDVNGARIKPNGATGPGTAKPFQFRRWTSAAATDPVLFADAAHVFWIDNTPVVGDIVDLRKGGSANTSECQFMSGPGSTTFAIGFRAFHAHGVEHAGDGDDNSFMLRYGISWQRGLNGSVGSLGPAPAGGTNHTDVGETAGAVASGSETFANLLGAQTKCTFSVTLRVYAKHFTGSSRIQAYDYEETASFALEITPALP